MCNTCGCKKAESFEAEMPNIVIPHGVDITSKIEKLSQRLGKHRIMSQDLRDKQFEAESIDICDLCDNPSVWTDGNVHRCNPCYQQKGAPYQLQRNMRNVKAAETFEANAHGDWLTCKDCYEDRFIVSGVADDYTPECNACGSRNIAIMSQAEEFDADFVPEGMEEHAWWFYRNQIKEFLKGNLGKKDLIEIFKIDNNDLDAESFDADFDNAPYDSFDEAMSDNVSFPEKEYEIDDRDIYNPERAAMDMIRSNRALREQMEEQGVYVGRHPGYYDDNGQWVELMEHYDDYERIPNWLQGLVGVGLVGGLAFILNKMTNTFADTGNNTTEPTD
jgi:hypothetical protein